MRLSEPLLGAYLGPPCSTPPYRSLRGQTYTTMKIDGRCGPDRPTLRKTRDDPEWIHFGDSPNFIDMQLGPGEYTFTLQAGNDLHEAVEGLCEMISFTVVAGAA